MGETGRLWWRRSGLTVVVIVAAVAACRERLAPSQEATVVAKPVVDRTGPGAIPIDRMPGRNAKDGEAYLAMPVDELWKHVLQSQQLVVVGVKDPQVARGYFAGRSFVTDAQLEEYSATLLKVPGVSASMPASRDRRRQRPETEAAPPIPIMPNGRTYPAVIVRVGTRDALATLHKLPFVDFLEPLYPQVVYGDGIGCGTSVYPGDPSDTPLVVGQTPNLAPWALSHHGIPRAWGLFPRPSQPGLAVDLFVMDTGVFASQRQFWEVFSPPTLPVSRNFSEVIWGGGPRVKCSHGVRIAGLVGAPLDETPLSPNVVGVAWGSSVRSQKVGDGVVQYDTPVTGLTLALNEAATSTAALPMRKRVVLMAWGMPWESQIVRDAIVTAYDTNPNLIMVAAAGTALPNVVFPATMRRETVAVSLVDALRTAPVPPAYTLVPATAGLDAVGYGPEVDFVAVNNVSRGVFVPSTSRGVNSAGQSVDRDGNLVPATTLAAADIAEVSQLGGSSSAVSIIAGGIALVWSRMPDLTRDEVIARVVAASTCRSISGISVACLDNLTDRPVVGSGVPDFYIAAGGARALWIDGAPPVAGGPIPMRVGMDGDPTIFSLRWSTGATGPTATLTLQPGQTTTVTLSATNRLDNSNLSATRTYSFGPTTARTLYAAADLASFATLFDGHRVSAGINGGRLLPSGCFITGVAGQELTVGGQATGTPFGVPEASADRGNRGFSVSRTAFGPQNLDVLVTAWHDGLSAIRVRPVYTVAEAAGVDCSSGPGIQTTP